MGIVDIMNKWKEKGVNLYIHEENVIKLDTIIVPKEQRKQGIGSQIVKELCEYADRSQKYIILTTAVKDSHHGTTSKTRLMKFYKRFGFYHNHGRKKDFRFRENMIREPQ